MFMYYLLLVAIMTIVTMIVYCIDKRKAERHKWRIKESTLLIFSFLFGSIGGILSMYVIRHKNKHAKFVILNFLFLIIHIFVGYLVLKYL